MTLANNTDYRALALPYIAPSGAEVVVTLVKATFVRLHDGRLVLADDPAPVRTNDELFDAEGESSVRYPSDAGTDKSGVDVVVVGNALSSTPTEMVDVCVTVGTRVAPLRVYGERVFYQGAGGLAIGPAAKFERRAIVYEYAYGGTSHDYASVERRNPVGRGVEARHNKEAGMPAPTIEHPAHPLTDDTSAEPMGYGAIASHWLPRSDFAGTFDDTWVTTRMPLLPLDFDARYNNVAHPSLQFDELNAGECIAIQGMTETPSWHIAIPEIPLVVRGRRDDGKVFTGTPRIDTILVEPEHDRIELTLRQVFAKGRGVTLLREVQVDW